MWERIPEASSTESKCEIYGEVSRRYMMKVSVGYVGKVEVG